MLHDEIIGGAARQHALEVIQPLMREMRVHRIQNGDFLIQNHIRIIRHAVRNGVLPLEQIDAVIVNAYITDTFAYLHGGNTLLFFC